MKDNSKREDQPEECEFCEFQTADLKAYTNSPLRDQAYSHKWLCLLCASTPAGNACEYPRLYEGETATLKTTCFVGNTILKEIGKLQLKLDIAAENPATREWEGS